MEKLLPLIQAGEYKGTVSELSQTMRELWRQMGGDKQVVEIRIEAVVSH